MLVMADIVADQIRIEVSQLEEWQRRTELMREQVRREFEPVLRVPAEVLGMVLEGR